MLLMFLAVGLLFPVVALVVVFLVVALLFPAVVLAFPVVVLCQLMLPGWRGARVRTGKSPGLFPKLFNI
jgi:hypothetical protein